jgi:DsbC/DsbD-like thiol-disulfide interchange protein
MGPTHFRRLAVLPACLALLVAGTAVLARAPKSDDKVKVTAAATKPDADGNQVVTLNLDIEKPWHLYANPAGNDDLADSQVVVTVSAKDKPEAVKIEYPEGKLNKDAVVGDYRTYEGKVTIKAQVRRARGDTSPLEVSVKLQACSDKGCLLPATVKVQVP